jgi:hypothetical protein
MAGVVQDGEGFAGGHVEQEGDAAQVGVLGIGDVAVAPGRGSNVLEILAVGTLRGDVLEPKFDGQPGDGAQFVGADDPVFQDPVQDAEAAVDVAAVASWQAVHHVGQRWTLGGAAQGLLLAGDRLEQGFGGVRAALGQRSQHRDLGGSS